jgi:hypothetical protein
VPVSLRAVAAMVAWGLALAAALIFGTALPLALKLAGVPLLAACLWAATSDLAGWRGRLELGNDADGRWWLRRGQSSPEYVQFGARPLVLGDWVWLRLRGGTGRTFLLIDGGLAEPGAFRRLKVRLLLDPGGDSKGVEGP